MKDERIKIPRIEYPKIKRLRRKGFTYNKISKIYNVSYFTIYKIINGKNKKDYEHQKKSRERIGRKYFREKLIKYREKIDKIKE